MNSIQYRLVIISLLLSLFVPGIFSQTRMVKNPAVDFTATGTRRIVSIEFDPEATRVGMLIESVAGKRVSFPAETFLEDEQSGSRYLITGVQGGGIGQRITIPASGDTLVYLLFPPLDPETKTLTWGQKEPMIFGIDLHRSSVERSRTIPEEIRSWMSDEIGKYEQTGIKPFDSADFFSHGTARLLGYIRGYDPRSGFSTGIIYKYNTLTGVSSPVSIGIEPDGRFTVDIPLVHPEQVVINFNRENNSVYLEQGSQLGMLLDWDDFLEADRYDDHRFTRTQYIGPLEEINRELRLFIPQRLTSKEKQSIQQENDWPEVSACYRALLQENLTALEALRTEISEDAFELLRYSEYIQYGYDMLDYDRTYRPSDPSRQQELPVDFYAFLGDLPLDDPGLLTAGKWHFINRFEFIAPFSRSRFSNNYKPLKDYLEQDEQVILTQEDLEYFEQSDSLIRLHRLGREPDSLYLDQYKKSHESFFSRYGELVKRHESTYKLKQTYSEQNAAQYAALDHVYFEDLGMSPSLIYDISKLQKLRGVSPDRLKDWIDICRVISDWVDHPFLREEVWRIFEETLPRYALTPYTLLPEGEATDKFRAIADQFKGNLVLVDFWSTTCGPCVSGIKRTKDQRKALEKQGKVTYLFITNDVESPQKAYDEFVEDQEITHTFRVNTDDWNQFRELFKFSGIPRYILLDEQGRVLDGKFNLENLTHELKRYQK